ncbi:MAG: AIM24 family protein, partial [Acidobacteriota bacterium]
PAAGAPHIQNTHTPPTGAGAPFCGAAGLFLQKVSGVGTVLIHGSGDFQELNLRSGEQVQVSSGNLAAFSEHVDYDIVRVGGMRKTLFSGEGLFMTRLTGPGRVLLQSLKPSFGKATPTG